MSDKYVFISQPMKGKSDDDIKRERMEFISNPQVGARICDELGSENFKVMDSILGTYETSGVRTLPVFYLGKSLDILSHADLAVFMPGWERGNGCVMEHHACVLYGIPHIDF